MVSTEERLKVLQMLEEGKISAEEAATLLRAMDKGKQGRVAIPTTSTEGRYLHVRVTDAGTGNVKVNVTIPLSLVNVGLRMAERFAPEFEDIEMQEISEIIASGAVGKIVEVMDAEDNELVEVFVE